MFAGRLRRAGASVGGANTSATLSIEDARRVALNAQGLRGTRVRTGGVPAMLRRLGAVQLDTISVLARSHELVAYARLGAIGRARVEGAYWGPRSATFEYWSHAACVLPLEDWPAYEYGRRARRAKGRRWHTLADRDRSCAEVVARLRDDGPLTANGLGGAKKGGPWWDWSETKIAVEWLLDIGEVVCRERRGFQRVYDLAERAVPAELLAQHWSDEECASYLVAAAGRSLGVAMVPDLARYHGLPVRLVREAVDTSGLLEVTVEGWKGRAYADPDGAGVARHPGAGAECAALTLRLAHVVPRAPRAPLRPAPPHGGLHAQAPAHLRLLRHARARRHVDRRRWSTRAGVTANWWPSRSHSSVTIRPRWRPSPSALADAATWVGAERVVVERMEPASRRRRIRGVTRILDLTLSGSDVRPGRQW